MKNPQYVNGILCCGECLKPMACADTRNGDSVASCSDSGCTQGQREFETGSIRHNPMIPAVRKTFQFNPTQRYYTGGANWTVRDGTKVSE